MVEKIIIYLKTNLCSCAGDNLSWPCECLNILKISCKTCKAEYSIPVSNVEAEYDVVDSGASKPKTNPKKRKRNKVKHNFTVIEGKKSEGHNDE